MLASPPLSFSQAQDGTLHTAYSARKSLQYMIDNLFLRSLVCLCPKELQNDLRVHADDRSGISAEYYIGLSLLLIASDGLQYSRFQRSANERHGRNAFFDDMSTPRLVENIIKDALDGVVSISAFVKIACVPFIARKCQSQIVRIVKQLLMDPAANKLSQTYQLISCLVTSINVQSVAMHQAQNNREAATVTSLNEQVSQLLIIYKSRYFNLQKSSQQFRIGCFSNTPNLIGNCCNSWKKELSFNKRAGGLNDDALSPLISYLEVAFISTNPSSTADASLDIIHFEVDDFLNNTLSYCIQYSSSGRGVSFSRNGNQIESSDTVHDINDSKKTGDSNRDGSGDDPSGCSSSNGRYSGSSSSSSNNNNNNNNNNNSSSSSSSKAYINGSVSSYVENVMESFNHCRLLLSDIIMSSDEKHRSFYLTAISFSLGSHLSKTLRGLDKYNITASERSALEVEIAYIIAMASVFIFPSHIVRHDHSSEDHSFRSFSDALGELYEVMSFAVSVLCCITPSTPCFFEDSGYLRKHRNGTVIEELTHEFDNEDSSKVKEIGAISLPRVAINEFIRNALFKRSIECHYLNITNQCVRYISHNIPGNSEEVEFSVVGSFYDQVDRIFQPFNFTHRSAIVCWTDQASNPRTFFSLYVLQCILIRVFCRLVESDDEYLYDDENSNYCVDGNDRGSAIDVLEDKEAEEIDKERLNNSQEKNRAQNIKENENKNKHSEGIDVIESSVQHMLQLKRRGEAYSLISSIASGMFHRTPTLFLQILCDAVTCALAVVVEKKVLKERKGYEDSTVLDEKDESLHENQLDQNFNIIKDEQSGQNNIILEKSNKSIENRENKEKEKKKKEEIKLNIVNPMIDLLLDVSDHFGATLSQLLSASIKSKNYFSSDTDEGVIEIGDGGGGGGIQGEKSLEDLEETSPVVLAVGELGSGFLASAIILSRVTHSRYSQEVSTYV
jgi:hypothetical protein